MESKPDKAMKILKEIRSHVTAYQGDVLDYIVSHQDQYLTYKEMSDNTGILYNTVKRSVASLENKVIEKYDICKLPKGTAFKLRLRINRRNRVIRTFTEKMGVNYHEAFDPEKDYSVDPSVYKEWTDKEYDDESVIKMTSELKIHPELRWWYEREMTVEKINRWCEEFQVNNVNMTHSLRYFAYDMRINRRCLDGDGKPIQNFTNYFYNSIKKNGGRYDKPENYKTHRALLKEEHDAHVIQREKEIKALREARLKKEAADHEFAFEQMLADPDSDIYNQCLKTISQDYQLRQLRTGRPSDSTKAMRLAYAEIKGIDGFEEKPDYLKEARGES